jgi:hypothetical protein
MILSSYSSPFFVAHFFLFAEAMRVRRLLSARSVQGVAFLMIINYILIVIGTLFVRFRRVCHGFVSQEALNRVYGPLG